MKYILLLMLLVGTVQAELIRVVSKGDDIITSIKINLYDKDPNKIYVIIYQEYDTQVGLGVINKYLIGYKYSF